MPAREFVVFETVERKSMTCDLGCEHKRAVVLRRYDLAVVESRTVPNVYLAAYGQRVDGTGFRAVDQFGDEWKSDWDGVHGDGPSGVWTTSDGRRAERGFVTADGRVRPRVYDGYVLEGGRGAPVPA